MNSAPGGNNGNRMVSGLLGIVLGLSGCMANPPPEPKGHIKPPERSIGGDIPTPVEHSQFVDMPDKSVLANDVEVYSIGVSDMPVRDLLYALARDAKLNVDINPGVQGRVTLNAIEQTLPRILERVAQQVDLRYEVRGDTLIVSPDLAFLKTYPINYINIQRSSDIQMSLNSRIDTGSNGEKNAIASENSSSVNVGTRSQNEFWKTLVNNVRGIIKEEQVRTKVPSIPAEPGGAEEEQKEVTLEADKVESEGNSNVFANPQSGLLTVRATSRQHAEIQAYLDQVMVGARRQVRIEATLVEVELSDQFQSGVDWSVVRDLAHNRQVTAIPGTSGVAVTTNLTNTQATPLFQDAPNFTMSTLSAASGLGNITATVRGVTSTVRLLEQFGKVQVLSTPRLVTLNNQVAVLKVVDNEVYFTIEAKTDEDENTRYTSEVHTVPVGLVMSVLPQISPSEEVTLIVRPTITRIVGYVQDPNPGLTTVASQVPKVQVREMEAILRVESGQVAMIGGLMQNRVDRSDAMVPGFSRVPFLGHLFNYKNDSHKKTELIVFMRPTVVSSHADLLNSDDIAALREAHKKPMDESKVGKGYGYRSRNLRSRF
ncbi:secretin N-terminal domain-containing protein [Magnetococcales bacterium HHB-1]